MKNIQKCSVAIFKNNELLTIIETPFFEGFQIGHKIRIEESNKTYRVTVTEIEHNYYYNNNNTNFVHEIRVIAS